MAEFTRPGLVERGDGGEHGGDAKDASGDLAGDLAGGIEGQRKEHHYNEREEEHRVDRVFGAPLDAEVAEDVGEEIGHRARARAQRIGELWNAVRAISGHCGVLRSPAQFRGPLRMKIFFCDASFLPFVRSFVKSIRLDGRERLCGLQVVGGSEQELGASGSGGNGDDVEEFERLVDVDREGFFAPKTVTPPRMYPVSGWTSLMRGHLGLAGSGGVGELLEVEFGVAGDNGEEVLAFMSGAEQGLEDLLGRQADLLRRRRWRRILRRRGRNRGVHIRCRASRGSGRRWSW